MPVGSRVGSYRGPPSLLRLKLAREAADELLVFGADGGAMNDEWHIRIDRKYLDPAAGSGARAKAEELATGKGSVRRLL